MFVGRADKVSLNTAIILRPDFLREASTAVGAQSIVATIDAKRRLGGWGVWIKGGSEETALDAIAWAQEAVRRGAGELLVTSMDSDGTKEGYDLELLRTISECASVPLIASGGAGSKEHIRDAITLGKADAVLAASIFHYQQISLMEIKKYLAENTIPVRL